MTRKLRKYTEDEVVRALSKKNDTRVFPGRKTIELLSDTIITRDGNTIPNPQKRNDIGNGSWGKISFLVKYKEYFLVRVPEFSRS